MPRLNSTVNQASCCICYDSCSQPESLLARICPSPNRHIETLCQECWQNMRQATQDRRCPLCLESLVPVQHTQTAVLNRAAPELNVRDNFDVFRTNMLQMYQNSDGSDVRGSLDDNASEIIEPGDLNRIIAEQQRGFIRL